jgi:sec-independent protein translocase protein TatA
MFAVFMPGPLELIIFGVIILLLFGSRLPGIMRSMGSSVSEFKKGVRDSEDDTDSKKS